MKLPVVVVVQNRLGRLNHTVLTVQASPHINFGARVLSLNATEAASDVAVLTNADILQCVLDVPLLAGLGENLTELPADWRLMLESTTQ